MYQRRLGLGNDLRTVQFTSSLINAMMCMHSHHFGDDYDDYDDDDEHESDLGWTCLQERGCEVGG